MISSPWRPGIALATQVLEFCKVLDLFYKVLEFHKNPRFGKSLNPDLGVLEGGKMDRSLKWMSWEIDRQFFRQSYSPAVAEAVVGLAAAGGRFCQTKLGF